MINPAKILVRIESASAKARSIVKQPMGQDRRLVEEPAVLIAVRGPEVLKRVWSEKIGQRRAAQRPAESGS
jgi:hypothetical protein